MSKLSLFIFREDGPIETLTFLCLLASSVIMVNLYRRFRSQHDKGKAAWCCLLLGLLFFFGAMEEISWGQRIFNFQIEFIQHASTQNETNLHNLKVMKSLGKWSPWLKVVGHPDRMFALFMFCLTVLLPLMHAISTPMRHALNRLQIPVTTWKVSLACIVSFLLPEMIDLASDSIWLHHVSQELKESLFALTLLGFSLHAYRCPATHLIHDHAEPAHAASAFRR